MNLKMVVTTAVALGLATAVWCHRGAAGFIGRPGESAPSAAGPTLRDAGVHKCVGAGGTLYADGACPRGSREVATNGGTVTVMSFPKASPTPSAIASSVFGGPVVKPLDPDARDRLRDKAVEDAANRR